MAQRGRGRVKAYGGTADPLGMDRSARRDVGVASAVGGALVAATLAFGHVFAPAGPSVVRPALGGVDGAPIAVAGGPRARSDRSGTGARRTPTAATGGDGTADAPDGQASGTARAGRAPADPGGGARGSTGAGGGPSSPADRGEDPGDGSGDGSPTATPGTTPPAGTAAGDEPTVGDDGTLITAAVRIRVTDLSVTGTDSGTLRAGSEVRVRLATARETVTTGSSAVRPAGRSAATDGTAADGAATDGAATDGAARDDAAAGVGATVAGPGTDPGPSADPTAAGTATSGPDAVPAAGGLADPLPAPLSAAPLPGRLDVRIRLDDAAVAALGSTTAGTSGPVALRALVDLVDDRGTGPYAVRVRMQLAPAGATRAAVADAQRTADGASNVVAVVTPIGTSTGADGGGSGSGGGTTGGGASPGAPTDGGPAPADPAANAPGGAAPAADATPGAAADPVEVRVPLPTGDAVTTPDDGASVPVPIPADAGPPAGGIPAPTTADAAVVVHLPAADEPIGGTPEDLTVAPDPVPEAPSVEAGSAADAGPSVDPDATPDVAAAPGADPSPDASPTAGATAAGDASDAAAPDADPGA